MDLLIERLKKNYTFYLLTFLMQISHYKLLRTHFLHRLHSYIVILDNNVDKLWNKIVTNSMASRVIHFTLLTLISARPFTELQELKKYTHEINTIDNQLHKYHNFQIVRDIDNYTNEIKTIENLLHKYKNFQIIFHVDNYSQLLANEALKIFDSDNPVPVMIYNHNSKPFTRPTETKLLHFVLLQDPRQFVNYLHHKRNVLEIDVVIFTVSNLSFHTFSERYWFMPHLDRAGNTLVISFNRNHFIEVHRLCFYCAEYSGKLKFLKNIHNSEVNLPRRALFPREFKNFYGHLMRVAYIAYYPFVFCSETIQQNGETVCETPLGVEVEILKILSEKMNFTYQLFEIEENYSKLFDLLGEGRYDFAIGGLSLTPERFSKVQFSAAFRIEYIAATFYYQTPVSFIVFMLLLPFPAGIWVGLVLSILLMTLLFYYMAKFNKTNPKLSLFSTFKVKIVFEIL
jgi:hypothetical protein